MICIRYFPTAFLPPIYAVLMLLPLDAVAQDFGTFFEQNYARVYDLSGDTCHARNTASEVGKSLRKINGSLRNTHEEIGATVYCPIVIPQTYNQLEGPDNENFVRVERHELVAIKAEVLVLSSTPIVQEVWCTFSIIEVSGEVIQTKRNSQPLLYEGDMVRIQKRFSSEDSPIANERRFTVECGLPPLSEITLLRVTYDWNSTVTEGEVP
jgi:hypothetical protein